jgi:hypothetical protein
LPSGRPRLVLQFVYGPKVDWAQIMVDLYNAGCPVNRVSTILGVSYCAANNWTKGGEPGYGYGRALLRLHARICGAGLTTRREHEGDFATTSSGAMA